MLGDAEAPPGSNDDVGASLRPCWPRGNAAAALVLTQHMQEGIVAIRALGHDGRILLDQLAKEAAR